MSRIHISFNPGDGTIRYQNIDVLSMTLQPSSATPREYLVAEYFRRIVLYWDWDPYCRLHCL
jgi:hypothetical protein